jgi:hypothetical protein
MKAKKKNSVLEQVKATRKQSREEEIHTHGKSINYRKVMESKKQYNRKKNKADDEVLPYLFIFVMLEFQLRQFIYGKLSMTESEFRHPFFTKYLHVFLPVQTIYYLP